MLRLLICSFCLLIYQLSHGQNLPGSGNALNMNTNGFISINNFGVVTFPLTITAWVKVDDLNPFQTIFQSDGTAGTGYRGFRLQIHENMILHMGIGEGVPGCYANQCTRWWSAPMPQYLKGTWMQVAGVMPNANTCLLYVNGVLLSGYTGGVGQFIMATSANPTANIGTYVTNQPINQFKGQLDEVAIWNIALTQAQIREYMCMRVPANTPGLHAVYRFDEASGTNINDSGPNGKNGTLTNGNLRVVSGAPIGDESAYFYPLLPGTLINAFNDTIQVALGSGNPEGYHIYSVNQQPNHSNGLPVGDCPPDRYYGVFHANSPSAVVSSFTVKNRGDLLPQPYVRNNNADPLWVELLNSSPFYISISTEDHTEIIAQRATTLPQVESKIEIPNVFTPNNDGINDFFEITIEGGKAAVWVYNRWGQEVFYSKNYDGTWNGTFQGKPLASGAYAYRVDFQAETLGCNGILQAEVNQYFGFVHIIP